MFKAIYYFVTFLASLLLLLCVGFYCWKHHAKYIPEIHFGKKCPDSCGRGNSCDCFDTKNCDLNCKKCPDSCKRGNSCDCFDTNCDPMCK
jgi:hypothetical protein